MIIALHFVLNPMTDTIDVAALDYLIYCFYVLYISL